MKKTIFALFILIILITSNLFAENSLQFMWDKDGSDEWNTQDTVLQLTFSTLLIIDFWQTYTFLYTDKHQQSYVENGVTYTTTYNETNLFLEENPSKLKLFSYVGFCLVGHFLISYILPNPFRTIWQIAWSCIEIKYIRHNYQLDVRIINKQF